MTDDRGDGLFRVNSMAYGPNVHHRAFPSTTLIQSGAVGEHDESVGPLQSIPIVWEARDPPVVVPVPLLPDEGAVVPVGFRRRHPRG